MKKIFIVSIITVFFMEHAAAQLTIPLYENSIPGSKPYNTKELWEPQDDGDSLVHYISKPTLTIFLPEKTKATGTAVIICPGGGYWVNSILKEGYNVAKLFQEWGVAAFVLKYRIPNDSAMVDKSIALLQDAQRALQLVRMRVKDWNIDISKVGIMGFSAGGHLASTAATHFQHNYLPANNNINLRPDFAILIYPVISFQDSIAHIGSRDQLIGKNPKKILLDSFSNELQVTKDTPPTFLMHAGDDDVVPVMNSITFYKALLSFKIPAELHIYKGGGHGFGMHNSTTEDQWMLLCKNWMRSMGWLKKI